LNSPTGLALDLSNPLHIGDYSANRVQKFLSGILNGSTVASQANGAKNRTPQTLSFPVGVFVDYNNNIYVADSGNVRIQLWSSGASSGTTIAGNGKRRANIVNVTEGDPFL